VAKGVIKHIGTATSGRYPKGSGEDPEQHSATILGDYKELKRAGMTDSEIAKGRGLTPDEFMRAKTEVLKAGKKRRLKFGEGLTAEEKSHLLFDDYKKLRSQGMTDLEIAKSKGISSTEFRQRQGRKKDDDFVRLALQANRLKETGMSTSAIGREMGTNESNVRSYLEPARLKRAQETQGIADGLKACIDKVKYVDVGKGTNLSLNVSPDKLATAVTILEDEGYKLHYVKVQQPGTGKDTNMKILAAPGIPYKEVNAHKYDAKSPAMYFVKDSVNAYGYQPINSIARNKVMVRYAEDGGALKDGTLELRRGLIELDMGKARYAQVRVGVEGNMFMKGMAIYGDDMPSGIDIIYNSNKARGAEDSKVFKPFTKDPDNPFGAVLSRQNIVSMKEDGVTPNVGHLNIVNEEGDWADWSKTLSSQVMSKQRPAFAKRQLALALDEKVGEYREIMALTNPALKKKFLEEFSDACDGASVDLKAAAMPRQASSAILPFNSIKPTEVYAPQHREGEMVVLIRHPHGGPFEIPQLMVNNKNPEALKTIGDARDAIGIHPSVAVKLSGADFDGDTVLVIPNDGSFTVKPSFKSLIEFDPRALYKNDTLPKMPDKTKQRLMGEASNLITDMTVMGASDEKIIRAVKHSMVVIDAQKHSLDYRASFRENGIAALKKEFQGKANGGASTLISKASSDQRVGHRKDFSIKRVSQYDPSTGKMTGGVNPLTGEKVYDYTNESYVKTSVKDTVTGKLRSLTREERKKLNEGEYIGKIKQTIIERQSKTTKMEDTPDARTLISKGGTEIETIYADHANALKDLANSARKVYVSTPNLVYSKEAKEFYAPQVESLKAKQDVALANRPLEREAIRLANREIEIKRQAKPDMDAAELKKVKGQALTTARARLGKEAYKIVITDIEWQAIQAGAISNHTLNEILDSADLDQVKERALPRLSKTLSVTQLNRVKQMRKNGIMPSEIANALGITTNALYKALEEDL
jgi:predicted transcriptional regulator